MAYERRSTRTFSGVNGHVPKTGYGGARSQRDGEDGNISARSRSYVKLAFALALAMLLIVIPLSVSDEDTSADVGVLKDGLTFASNGDGTVAVVGHDCTTDHSELTIPSTVSLDLDLDGTEETYNVTAIGNNAFFSCFELTSVTMPSVTTIGNSAFSVCENLETVTMPSIETIGDGAFFQCKGLVTLDLSNVKTIGADAFIYCINLVTLDLPSVTTLEIGAFGNCNKLESVTIPNVTSIDDRVFEGCTSLQSIFVGDGNERYYDSNGILFDGVSKTLMVYPAGRTAPSYEVPDGTTSIGPYAFQDCSSIKAVDLPSSVKTIGIHAFYYCTGLTTIDLSGVTKIGEYAFYDTILTTVTLDNVTSIGNFAFSGCPIKTLTLKDTISDVMTGLIGSWILPGMSAKFDTLIIDTESNLELPTITGSAGKTIRFSPDSKNIDEATNTFYRTADLDVTMGSSELAGMPFGYDTAVNEWVLLTHTITFTGNKVSRDGTGDAIDGAYTEIKIKADQNYNLPGIIVITVNGVELGSDEYDYDTSTGTISIPGDKVTGPIAITAAAIGSTFETDTLKFKIIADEEVEIIDYLQNIEVLEITEVEMFGITYTITFIGDSMFHHCQNLKTVTLSNVTLGSSAFHSCPNLKTVTLSNVIVGDSAFHDCEKLETLALSNVTLGSSAFHSCPNLKTVTLSNAIVGDSAFHDCEKLETLTIYGVTTIGSSAFHSCSNLETVDIPNSVTFIGDGAFLGCTGLKNIHVEDSNVNYYDIDGVLFDSAKTLMLYPAGRTETSYNVPAGTTSIGTLAFENCSKIKTMNLPSSVKTIGNSAFKGCTNLDTIDLSDVTKIEGYAFENTALTILDISNMVEIGEGVFSACSQLGTVTISNMAISEWMFEGCTALTTVTLDNVTSIGDSAFFDCPITILTLNGTISDAMINLMGPWVLPGMDTSEYDTLIIDTESAVVLPEIAGSAGKTIKFSLDSDNIDTIANPFYRSADSSTSMGSSELAGTTFVYDTTASKWVASSYTITFTGNEVFRDGTGDAVAGANTEIKIKVDQDHTLPETIVITVGGIKLGSGEYDYDTSTGTINIPGDKVKGPIAITAAAIGSTFDSETLKFKIIADGEVEITGYVQNIDVLQITEIERFGITYTITSIGGSAFNNCVSLRTVIIPSGVTFIGDSAFAGCTGLESISVEAGNEKYYDIDGILFDGISKTLMVYPATKPDTKYTVPSGTISIGSHAFQDCSSIKAVDLPSSVKTIGSSAFKDCTSLDTIDLSNVEKIGNNAFVGIAITTLNISNIEVGSFVFVGCTQLETVTISNMAISPLMFSECESLTTVTLENVTTISNFPFTNCPIETVILKGDTLSDTMIQMIGSWKWNDMEYNTLIIDTESDLELPAIAGSAGKTIKFSLDSDSIDVTANPFYKTVDPNVIMGSSELAGMTFVYDTTTSKWVLLTHTVTVTGNKVSRDGTGGAPVDAYTEIKIKADQNYNLPGIIVITVSGVELGSDEYEYDKTTGLIKMGGDKVTGPIVITAAAIGSTFETDTLKFKIIADEEVEITGNKGKITGLSTTTVSEYGITYTITSIGDNAFRDCTSLETVDISSVTSVGDNAFEYSNIKTVNMPSVTKIGNEVFLGCIGLETVSMSSVTSVGNKTFEFCSKLTTVNMPNLSIIGSYAFYHCASLETMDMPNVTSIGSLAFSSSGLKTVNMPSVTTIDGLAFESCSKLTTVTMNNVTSIGSSAFRLCSGLKNIYIEDSNVKYYDIDGVLFDSAKTLMLYPAGRTETSYNVPDGTTSIGTLAFENCSKIKTLNLPSSVTTLGFNAFNGCTSLTSLTMPIDLAIPDETVFANVKSVTDVTFIKGTTGSSVNYNLTTNTYTPWYRSSNAGNSITVTINEGVTSVGEFMFRGCSNLVSVSIPNSVRTIENNAFNGCSGLMSIEMPIDATILSSAFTNVKSVDTVRLTKGTTGKGVDYNGESAKGTPWYISSVNPNGIEIVIEDAVTHIGEFMFAGSSGIKSVTLPGGLKTIGKSAFNGCSGLTSVKLPDSVTSIGENAFRNCTGLTSVELPDSVTSIAENAFRNCTGLTSVEISNNVTFIRDGTFAGCENLTAITMPIGATSVSTAFSGVTLGSVKLTGGTTGIGVDYTSSTYKNTPWFTSTTGGNSITVTIGDDVTRIGNYTFYKYTGLVSIKIPKGVETIGINAFNGCSNLVSIDADKDNTAFSSEEGVLFDIDKTTLLVYPLGKGVDSYTVPDGVLTIAARAFNGCTSLTSLTISDSVTTLGPNAFDGCTSLTSLTMPIDLAIPDATVFVNVDSVTDVTFTEGTTGSSANYDSTRYKYTPWYRSNNVGNNITVTIGEGITSIGEYIFSGCVGIKTIIIPDGVTVIGDHAFNGCSGLTSITIPIDTMMAKDTFSGTTATSFILTKGVNGEGMDHDATTYRYTPWFISSNAGKGITVTIGNGITSIGEYMFSGCVGIKTIIIPDGVTVIGDHAFNGCSRLMTLTMPIDTSMSAGSFSGTGVTSFILTKGVNGKGMDHDATTYTYTPWYISSNAGNSITVEMNEGMTSIGDHTFRDCTRIWSITIPDSVTSIGDHAFSGCSGIPTVTISKNVTNIGDMAFNDCSVLKEILVDGDNASYSSDEGNGILFNKIKTELILYLATNKRTEYTIPGTVTSIADHAFSGCKITALTIVGTGNDKTPVILSQDDPWTAFGLTKVTRMTFDGPMLIPDGFSDLGKDKTVVFTKTSTDTKGCTFFEGDGSTGVEGADRAGRTFVFDSNVNKWMPTKYVITVMSDKTMGDTTGSGTYYEGSSQTITATANAGHRFMSWNDGPTDSPRTIYVDGDMTYVASFAELYTIVFNTNGGSDIDAITAIQGEAITWPADPERTGYTFGGWYDNPEFNGVPQVPVGRMPLDGMGLYAKWVPVECTITLDPAGGVLQGANTMKVKYDQSYVIPSPGRDGYMFQGWYDGDTKFVSDPTRLIKNVTLTAKWEPLEYTITFDSNGGSAVISITADCGTEITRPADPEKEGHEFKGWYEDPELENEAEFDTMPFNGGTMYAKWSLNDYMIVFNENSGSAVKNITAGYGTAITWPADPSRDGCRFAGWYDNPGCTGEAVEYREMPLDGDTLHARWIHLVTVGDGSTTTVIIPVQTEEAEVTAITINGTVHMLPEVVESSVNEYSETKLKLEKVKGSSLTSAQRNAIGNAGLIIGSELLSDGSRIGDLGGSVTITLDYTLRPGENQDNIYIGLMDSEGNIVRKDVTYDPDARTATFVSDTMPEYIFVGCTENISSGEDDGEGSNIMIYIAVGAVIAVVALAGSVFYIKRK